MAGTDLEKLVVSLSTDLKSYERGLAKAQNTTISAMRKMEKDMQAGATRMEKSLGRVGSAIGGFGKGLVIGGVFAAVGGLEQLITTAVSGAAAIGDLSGKLGISSTKLQELQYGAVQANMDFADLETGLLKFSKTLGQARNGSGELRDILKTNGFSDAQIKALSYSDALDAVADLTKNAKDEQDALLVTIAGFGKGVGDKFLEFLRDGKGGLQKYKEGLETAGGAIDKNLIKKAQELDDKWAAAMSTMKTNTQSFVLDAITGFDTVLTSAQSSFKDIQDAYEFTKKVLSGAPTNGTRLEPDGFGGFNIVDDRPSNNPVAPPGTTSGAGKGSITNSAGLKPKKTVVETVKAHAAAVADLTKKVIELTPEEQHLNDLYEAQIEMHKKLVDSEMELAQTGFDAFESIVLGGEKATDVIKDLALQMLKAATAASLFGTGPFASIFGTGGSGGFIGGLLGKRASGGHVNAGQPYMVGEQGRELFVPSQSGSIVPKLGGGSAKVSVNVMNFGNDNVDVRHRNGPNGPSLDVMIGQKINSHIGSGQADSVLRARHGITPQKTRR